MATWTNPSSYTTGQLIDATIWNALFGPSGNLGYLRAATSWTPTIESAGGGTPTYTSRPATYHKTTEGTYIWGDITLATKGTLAAGHARIGGLPVAAQASADMPIVVGYFTGMTTSVVHLGGHVVAGASRIDLYHLTAAATAKSATQVSDLGATVRIMFSAYYIGAT